MTQSFDIIKYGALGGGKTINSHAVQKAIDTCYQNGDCKVLIPTGVIVIGTVILKSNVHLYLENGNHADIDIKIGVMKINVKE